MNVLIAGGSGLVGAHLTTHLVNDGHSVRHLSRKRYKHLQAEVYEWDLSKKTIEPKALENIDAVVNLAGAGVGDQKWSKNRKAEILESRVDAVDCLYQNLSKLEVKPKVIINASAIGYYGNLPFEQVSKESDPSGDSFLAKVCVAWEKEAERFKELGCRLVIPRIGVVLSDRGGALAKMIQPIQFFVGAPLGSGNQMVGWIHISDLCQMISTAIVDENYFGVFNAVGTNPVTNTELTKAIGKKIHRPVFLPNVPSVILKLILGAMAGIALEGNVISNQKLLDVGFTFKFDNINQALDELLAED